MQFVPRDSVMQYVHFDEQYVIQIGKISKNDYRNNPQHFDEQFVARIDKVPMNNIKRKCV